MRKLAYHVHRHFCIIFALISAVIVMADQKAKAATQAIQTLPFYDSFDYNPGGGLANA